MSKQSEADAARKVANEKARADMHRNVHHPANQTVANRAMQDKGYPERKA